MATALKLAIGSVFIGIAVLALKAFAWWLTGSVALLSDALESTVNVATALAALIAIRLAAIPADANHPYGHHKAEFLSAVLEGVMIVVAALLILREAWQVLAMPVPIDAPVAGLAVNMLATVINAAWAFVLIRGGRRHRSPALVADGRHLTADVVSSGGVAVGVVLAVTTGWWMLDPIMAILVALNILWSGAKVIKESLGGLMDEALPVETLTRIEAIIRAEATGAVEAHDLKTRYAGRATFIDFHLVMPGDTTVFEAHELCDRIEAALKSEVEGASIAIHVEPEHKAKETGVITPH